MPARQTTNVILAVAVLFGFASAADGQKPRTVPRPEAEPDARAIRLLDTRMVSRGALQAELRRLGKPSSPDEAKQRGRGESDPVTRESPRPPVPAEAARRVDQIIREGPPGRDALLRLMETTPHGREQLEKARRAGAPIGAGSSPGATRPPIWGGTPFLPSEWVSAGDPERAVSYALTVSNHRRSNPTGILTLRDVAVAGPYVTLSNYSSSCASLYHQLPAAGWYVISMTAVTYGPVRVVAKGPYGSQLDEWSFNKRGYNIAQFPRLAYYSRATNSDTSWCAESGSLLFASVTLHSF